MLTEGKRNDRKSEQERDPSGRKNDHHYVASPATAPGTDYSEDIEDEANDTGTDYIATMLTNLANKTVTNIIKDKKHKKEKKDKKVKKDTDMKKTLA